MLERIVWPHVRSLLVDRLRSIEVDGASSAAASSNQDSASTASARVGSSLSPPIIVVEAAVLLDAGWSDLFDAIWVVRSPQSIQRERLTSDRGMDGQDADARIEAQNSRRGIGNLNEETRKGGCVKCVIDNDGTIDELRERLRGALYDPESWGEKGESKEVN